jgi:pimeloyl-ACP methyl ester carboxylesterase
LTATAKRPPRGGHLSSTTTGLIAVAVSLLGSVASADLAFQPCVEADHEQFECATLAVPLDRSGTVPGTIDLHVERLASAGPLPILIALSGGPGGSATILSSTFARIFAPVAGAYQLVVFDQRGTGLSGVLDCPEFDDGSISMSDVGDCAAQLGPAAQFYTTADSVLDIEAVRMALGGGPIALTGISYGTFVALEYARTFPNAVSRLVLDSIMPPEGLDAYELPTFGASSRILRQLCDGGACQGVTKDPVADTQRLVKRLRHPRQESAVGPDGSREPVSLSGARLLSILVAGDFSPALRALYPSAVASALHGDRAPLLRLAALTADTASAPAAPSAALRSFSSTLQIATDCSDSTFPWSASDALDSRRAEDEAFVRAVPPAALSPFDATTLRGIGSHRGCLFWPFTSLPRARSTAAAPDLLALLLDGADDLRTPSANGTAVAALLPRSVLVTVPFAGHSVLTGTSCARTAVERFLTDTGVDDPCSTRQRVYSVQARPPKTLGQIRAYPGVPGRRGRTALAAYETLRDAFFASVATAHSAIAIGGLRAGTAHGTNANGRLDLVLDHYVYLHGVAVSGSLSTSAADGLHAVVDVAGRAGGHLTFGPNGALDGTLGGRAVHVEPTPLGAVAHLAPDAEALEPIL